MSAPGVSVYRPGDRIARDLSAFFVLSRLSPCRKRVEYVQSYLPGCKGSAWTWTDRQRECGIFDTDDAQRFLDDEHMGEGIRAMGTGLLDLHAEATRP